MRPASRTARALACAAVLALAPACRQAGPAPPVVAERPPREWPIDHTRTTDDPVKSELLVRASQSLEAGDAAAESLYRQAIKQYPTDPDWYEALGACLYFQGRYDEARAEYHRGLQLNPRSADALYGLGCVARKQKRPADAVHFLEQALAMREGFGRCHHLLAVLYDEQEDPSKALLHYERAAALDPAIAADEDVRQRIAELKG